MEDTLSAPRIACRRKLPPRAAPVAFAFFMSAIMAFLMCCVIVGANTGIDAGYPARVLSSYGLAVRFDADFLPLYSVHSRPGGRNHGIVAARQRGDDLFLLSKGAGRVLRLSVSAVEQAWKKGTNE